MVRDIDWSRVGLVLHMASIRKRRRFCSDIVFLPCKSDFSPTFCTILSYNLVLRQAKNLSTPLLASDVALDAFFMI